MDALGVPARRPAVALSAKTRSFLAAGFPLQSLTRNATLASVVMFTFLSCSSDKPTSESLSTAIDSIAPSPAGQVSPFSSSGDGSRVSDNPNLFAFVGEKLNVEYFNPYEGTDRIPFDAGFKCKYKVLQWVYGKLPEDTVEFEAYTHRGSLFFDDFETVLLFVSRSGDKLYHEKYQFYPVYRTKNGRWANCGDPYLSDRRVGKGVPVLKLEFDSPPSFDFKVHSEKYSPEYVGAVFKEPWFNCHTDSATCNMGAYVEDLFRVKRDAVLMARELFYTLPDTSSRRPNQ